MASDKDTDFNTDDDDIEDIPGIMRDHPTVDKQLCECVTTGCENDALVRHKKDKKRFPGGPMCFDCRKEPVVKCEVCNAYCKDVYYCGNPNQRHAMCKEFVGRRRHMFCGRYGCGHQIVVD
jgi:hypothetical protein